MNDYPKSFKSRVIEVKEPDVFCWVDIAYNLSIKTRIPLESFRAAGFSDIIPGDRFVFYVYSQSRLTKSGKDEHGYVEKTKETEEYRRECKEIRERIRTLQQEWDFELRHLLDYDPSK